MENEKIMSEEMKKELEEVEAEIKYAREKAESYRRQKAMMICGLKILLISEFNGGDGYTVREMTKKAYPEYNDTTADCILEVAKTIENLRYYEEKLEKEKNKKMQIFCKSQGVEDEGRETDETDSE